MTSIAEGTLERQVEVLADRVRARRWEIAVAESLTGGMLSNSIAAGPDASEWFKGAVVAYQVATKHTLLGVSEGPVVTERCAVEMARGVSALLDAPIGLAVTGVGGPGPAEGHPPGTVWIAVHTPNGDITRLAHLEADSAYDVCTLSCSLAIDLANEVLEPPA